MTTKSDKLMHTFQVVTAAINEECPFCGDVAYIALDKDETVRLYCSHCGAVEPLDRLRDRLAVLMAAREHDHVAWRRIIDAAIKWYGGY